MSGGSLHVLRDLTTSLINRESLFYQVHSISTRTQVVGIFDLFYMHIKRSFIDHHINSNRMKPKQPRSRYNIQVVKATDSPLRLRTKHTYKTCSATRSAKPLPGRCCCKNLISSVAIYTYFYLYVQIYIHIYTYNISYMTIYTAELIFILNIYTVTKLNSSTHSYE